MTAPDIFLIEIDIYVFSALKSSGRPGVAPFLPSRNCGGHSHESDRTIGSHAVVEAVSNGFNDPECVTPPPPPLPLPTEDFSKTLQSVVSLPPDFEPFASVVDL